MVHKVKKRKDRSFLIFFFVTFFLEDRKIGGSKTRDVGTQSTPPEGSSSSPSPTSTPSIKERMIKRFEDNEDGDTTQNSSSSIKLNPVEEVCT